MPRENHKLGIVRSAEAACRLGLSWVGARPFLCFVALVALFVPALAFAEESREKLAPLTVENSEAKSPTEMKPYEDVILVGNRKVKFQMAPIPGGSFKMGSPDSETDRGDNEGPQHEVKIDPFWMGACEVTWGEYGVYMLCRDVRSRRRKQVESTGREKLADAVTRPSSTAYLDMELNLDRDAKNPAAAISQYAAKKYCEWLSAKTGRYYRLPTEAEWEYACRAGSKTAYSFGDDPEALDDYAWYYENTLDDFDENAYQRVGKKKPNAWGLFDMHGNVAEWVLDGHGDKYQFAKANGAGGSILDNPLAPPKSLYPRVARGGSYQDDADLVRSASRRGSEPFWREGDPNDPKTKWYLTIGDVGFRIVRPLVEPSDEAKKRYGPDKHQVWDHDSDGDDPCAE